MAVSNLEVGVLDRRSGVRGVSRCEEGDVGVEVEFTHLLGRPLVVVDRARKGVAERVSEWERPERIAASRLERVSYSNKHVHFIYPH